MKKSILTLLVVLLLLTACKAAPQKPERMPENIIEDVAIHEGKSEKTEEPEEPKEESPVISPKGLMNGASPSTSALTRYVWDGETVTRDFLFETPAVEEVLALLDEIPAAEAADWTPELVTTPIYGFEIADTNGRPLCGAWSNGYWITDGGTAYTFDFDFAALSGFNWREPYEFETTTVLPCARILSCTEDGWYPALLTKATEPHPQKGITLTIDRITDGEIKATFHNGSGEVWGYGEYFSLQVRLDGIWYEVPTEDGWAFHDIGYELAAGEKGTLSCNLAMYGDLPAGNYRLVTNGLTAEFPILQ